MDQNLGIGLSSIGYSSRWDGNVYDRRGFASLLSEEAIDENSVGHSPLEEGIRICCTVCNTQQCREWSSSWASLAAKVSRCPASSAA